MPARIEVKYDPRQLERVQQFLEDLPYGAMSVVIPAINEYIIGDFNHGLQHYPNYRYVSMKQAYGGFISDRQRKYVMAMIRDGKITPGVPQRNDDFRNAWETRGEDYRQRIVNTTSYGKYLMGDVSQANLPRLGGWRKTMDVVYSNLSGALRHARSKLREWLQSK